MKSHRKELWFSVPARRQLTNITPDVRDALVDKKRVLVKIIGK